MGSFLLGREQARFVLAPLSLIFHTLSSLCGSDLTQGPGNPKETEAGVVDWKLLTIRNLQLIHHCIASPYGTKSRLKITFLE